MRTPVRGSWWHRALSAVLAVWFGVSFAEPGSPHASSAHAATMAHAAAAAGAVAGAGLDCAQAGAGQSHGERDGHAPSAPDGSHQCTCLGACGAGSAPALPAVAARIALDLAVAPADPGRPEHEYVAAWVDFVLPFATAPPRVTRA